ncbi:LacI family DNA-binding transcriptional regulator [Agromyces italicus]|uniref:LacI family DNA-binding transcriptional regulator n=1 Tax=Agromyces italicus TaxID=279572 RepID=UPI0003B69ED3|nr:LacI family DNA-binding transcriptional regulator [Agromyces italicus]
MTTVDTAKPTLSEVARRAGVGRSSAARVLGNYGSVSAHTRERVLAAARELGYETNELARSMSTGVTMTLGVVVADIANPFFAGVLRGIADAAREAGYGTVLVNTDEDEAREDEAVRLLMGKQVDGIVIAPAGGAAADPNPLRTAQLRGVPIVQIDRTLAGLEADAVVMDNRHAARDATELLIAAGHRRIALVWGPARLGRQTVTPSSLERWATTTELTSVGERFLGYRAALDAADLELDPAIVMTGEQSIAGVRAFVRTVLATPRPPTAFIATELDAVIGVLEEVHAAGLRVPADMSIVGFDDSPWASVFDPPITTVRQPVQRLGEHAARRLIERISGAGGEPFVDHLASELIDRGSIAAPRG